MLHFKTTFAVGANRGRLAQHIARCYTNVLVVCNPRLEQQWLHLLSSHEANATTMKSQHFVDRSQDENLNGVDLVVIEDYPHIIRTGWNGNESVLAVICEYAEKFKFDLIEVQ